MKSTKVTLPSKDDAVGKKVITLKQLNPKLKQAVIRNINFKPIQDQQSPTPSNVIKLSKIMLHQEKRTEQPRQPTERVQQMKGGFEPLPLFDCFYCCKEHFVLRKCSECMISFRCN
jgi:hypothetical protein